MRTEHSEPYDVCRSELVALTTAREKANQDSLTAAHVQNRRRGLRGASAFVEVERASTHAHSHRPDVLPMPKELVVISWFVPAVFFQQGAYCPLMLRGESTETLPYWPPYVIVQTCLASFRPELPSPTSKSRLAGLAEISERSNLAEGGGSCLDDRVREDPSRRQINSVAPGHEAPSVEQKLGEVLGLYRWRDDARENDREDPVPIRLLEHALVLQQEGALGALVGAAQPFDQSSGGSQIAPPFPAEPQRKSGRRTPATKETPRVENHSARSTSVGCA
eukprot:scaffold1378_cov257-Pinguiococcus_pyrenoidosus.AAC.6